MQLLALPMSDKTNDVDIPASTSRMSLREAYRVIDDTLVNAMKNLRSDGIDPTVECHKALMKVAKLRQELVKLVEKHLINASHAESDLYKPGEYEVMDQKYMRKYESKKKSLEDQLSSYVEVLNDLKYQVRESLRWDVDTALQWASHDPAHAPAAKHQHDEGYWPACDKIFDQSAEARRYAERIGKMKL